MFNNTHLICCVLSPRFYWLFSATYSFQKLEFPLLSTLYPNSYLIKYGKTCLKKPLKKKTKVGFQDRFSLNEGQKYCRMLQGSILQYFRPSFSYHLSLRPLFCLILSGHLRQGLLYVTGFQLYKPSGKHCGSRSAGFSEAN